MPVYVYKGLETGNHYEFEQSFHDKPLKVHPETGEPLKRIITPPAIIFKGSGWHIKDYAKSSSPSKKSDGEKKDE
ncbi:MAG: FmdB family zinc ribbon protein [Thermaceae bacterium]